MKKLSTTALVIAAGMASSAQALDLDVGEDTTFTLFGDVETAFESVSTIENNDPNSGSTESTSDFYADGTVGVGVEHRYSSGLTAYMAAEFVYDNLGTSGGAFDRDESFVGIRGPLGDVRIGQYDNLFIDSVYDVIDPFENASLAEESASPDDSTIAYFSPNYGGFSYEVQARVDPESRSATGSNELALIGVAKYTADRWAVHAGVDDRGTEFDANGDELDPVYGVGGVFSVTDRLGVAARYSLDTSDPDGNDVAYYGAAVTFDYGMGDLYAAAQEVDPDEGDGQTQFAAGANYFIESNLYVFAEYGSFDAPNAPVNATDSIGQVGAIYEF